MPAKNLLLSVQESMFDDMVHVAHDLSQLGYKIHATDSTHEYLRDKGVEATLVKFPSKKGKVSNFSKRYTFYNPSYKGCNRHSGV